MASKLTKSGYAKLDAIIEEHGDEWLLKNLITRVAEGDDPKAISASIGLPYVVLRNWMEDNCADEVALAGRARADCLEYEASNAIENVDPDNLGVVKLQSDYKMKLAGKLDRKKYGDKTDGVMLAVQVNTNIISADISPHEAAQAYAAMVGKQNG